MGRFYRSRWSRIAAALGASIVGGVLIFGSFGSGSGPLGTGQAAISAQGAGAIQGQSGVLAATVGQAVESAAPPTEAQLAASQAHMERSAAAWTARSRDLPASDPRVMARVGAAAAPPAAETASTARQLPAAGAAPGPLLDSDFNYFRASTLNPAGAGLSSSSVNEPSAAQNGKYVIETWNWGAARSINGGATWTYISPYGGMADFCCDQDVVYDEGRDRFFWLRQGVVAFASPISGSENRDVISVDTGAGTACTYDIRPSLFGLGNAWLDYPRLSTSDNFLYLATNAFNSTTNSFVTHVIVRFALTQMAGCVGVPFTYWTFTAGWTPAPVENAHQIMYIGDQLVTSTGLNDQFRVAWIYDDSATYNFADRTIAPYLYTNRVGSGANANCPVPGGADPCERSDQRISGAVMMHNTPTPMGLGIAGDKVDFYWNVREGNGFPLPYVENASFQGNTLAYVSRKYIWNPGVTFFYAAAGANDRQHVGISLFQFNPVASGANPYHILGIDDDYNGRPPGWEIYVGFTSTGAWTASNSGDYLRARTHSPSGVAFIATGYNRNAAQGQYTPHYYVFGRARDVNGFNIFDQQP